MQFIIKYLKKNSTYYEVTFSYYDEAKYVFVGRKKEMLKTNWYGL